MAKKGEKGYHPEQKKPHVKQRVIYPKQTRIDGSTRKQEKITYTKSTKKDT